jgi:hypothetical protein
VTRGEKGNGEWVKLVRFTPEPLSLFSYVRRNRSGKKDGKVTGEKGNGEWVKLVRFTPEPLSLFLCEEKQKRKKRWKGNKRGKGERGMGKTCSLYPLPLTLSPFSLMPDTTSPHRDIDRARWGEKTGKLRILIIVGSGAYVHRNTV